jgi:hypothetical protein
MLSRIEFVHFTSEYRIGSGSDRVLFGDQPAKTDHVHDHVNVDVNVNVNVDVVVVVDGSFYAEILSRKQEF